MPVVKIWKELLSGKVRAGLGTKVSARSPIDQNTKLLSKLPRVATFVLPIAQVTTDLSPICLGLRSTPFGKRPTDED